MKNIKEFDLEKYEPKGQLIGFPKEIIAHMIECQKEQVDRRDVTVFENLTRACPDIHGFSWNKTKEGYDFWEAVIEKRNFDLFFEKYPKKEDNQEFKVKDKVYDILLREIGIVTKIIKNDVSSFPIEVYYEDCGRVLYASEGRFLSRDKYPRLLHYRDDYDYDVIDFNNLPKRQEANRWRAKVGETYYIITSNFEIENYCEENEVIDDEAYNSGNYFQTKEEAKEVADKLNKYFQELIKSK